MTEEELAEWGITFDTQTLKIFADESSLFDYVFEVEFSSTVIEELTWSNKT